MEDKNGKGIIKKKKDDTHTQKGSLSEESKSKKDELAGDVQKKKDDVVNRIKSKSEFVAGDMSSSSEDKKFIKGILLGSLAGAAATFIASPKSGKEVRGRIREGYGKAAEKVKERIEEIPEDIELWTVQKKDLLAEKMIETGQRVKADIEENYEYVLVEDENQSVPGKEQEESKSDDEDQELDRLNG